MRINALKIQFIVFCCIPLSAFSQSQYTINVVTVIEQCAKGSAQISGITAYDSLDVRWSTGQSNVLYITELSAGDYNVDIRVVKKHDSTTTVKDTLMYFTIAKEHCPLSVPKYFSPNDDGYNDRFEIANIQSYPDFELTIFNKWGQRVHHQAKNYIPWDGKWLGIDLPDATYYFVLFYDKSKSKELFKGDITILR